MSRTTVAIIRGAWLVRSSSDLGPNELDPELRESGTAIREKRARTRFWLRNRENYSEKLFPLHSV
jgi:hypothetical protein